MQEKIIHSTAESVPFGVLLAIAGGFMDAYTFVGRNGVFANAQTGNIVLLGVYASAGKWHQALLYVPPILAFIFGVIVTEFIKKHSSRLLKQDWSYIILFFEAAVLFAIGFIPDTVSNIVVTVIMSFISSVQISSFRRLGDSQYSTTMVTGNLRSAVYDAYTALTENDSEAVIRSVRLFIIILSFIFGAFSGGFTTKIAGFKAIWFAGAVMTGALIFFSLGESGRKGIINIKN